jgi:predicted Rossmann fold flavoprotein
VSKKFVIIGGGAAGMFAAVNAARMHPNLQVIVLEKSARLLAKVSISGGGRCNVTHNCMQQSEMIKNYPRGPELVKKTFRNFFTKDTLTWFGERGVPIVAEADGRMFPRSNSSESIIDCLIDEAKKYKVQIRLQTGVLHLEKSADEFQLQLTNKTSMTADYVLIACGGFPKREQFAWIEALGHTIQLPVPSLFTFNLKKEPIIELMGVVAQDALVKIKGTKLQFSGPVLITHWGLSGPAVLALSAYAARYLHEVNYDYKVQINWHNEFNETSVLQEIRNWHNSRALIKVKNKNPLLLVQRLWDFILLESEIDGDQNWNSLSTKQQNLLARNICSYEVQANGKTTYKEEFVTAGGVNLNEINLNTCASKLVSKLYFAGEILDVDGRTGGFNFQHAWSSGWTVAEQVGSE